MMPPTRSGRSAFCGQQPLVASVMPSARRTPTCARRTRQEAFDQHPHRPFPSVLITIESSRARRQRACSDLGPYSRRRHIITRRRARGPLIWGAASVWRRRSDATRLRCRFAGRSTLLSADAMPCALSIRRRFSCSPGADYGYGLGRILVGISPTFCPTGREPGPGPVPMSIILEVWLVTA